MHRTIWRISQYMYDRKCKVGVDKTVPCCARMNPKYGSLIIIHTKLFSPMLKGIIQLYNKNGCQCNDGRVYNISLLVKTVPPRDGRV